MKYDIIILGAGPSGSTLARLLPSSQNVLLVDKRDLLETSPEILSTKCCGGLLAPDAQRILSQLGLGLPKSVLEEPQLFAVRAIDLQCNRERLYQRFYINISRHRFDAWLLSLVPDHIDQALQTRVIHIEYTNDEYLLTLKKDKKTWQIRSTLLVGADGATSMVRREMLNSNPWPSHYIAIQEWINMDKQPPYFSTFFDPSITDFYAWTIPKKDQLLLGAALPLNRHAGENFDRLKAKLSDHGYTFGKTLLREGAPILRPTSVTGLCTGNDTCFLVGEAAGFISPSSADGLSFCFRSAIALAKAMDQKNASISQAYKRLTFSLKATIAVKNIKSPFMFNPMLRNLIMRSGLQSISQLNQDS